MDQLPESRSMVLSDALPGDFSDEWMPAPFMLAVSVDIEGRVCVDETGGVWLPVLAVSHGR